MPRTLEIYHFLGVLNDIKELGTPFMDLKEYDADGHPVKTFSMTPYQGPTPNIPESEAFALGQDAACRVLRNHLKKYGVEVELETELVGFEQHDDHVTATLVKRQTTSVENIKYLVGADGAKGIVRKLLGLEFLGETRDKMQVLIGDIEIEGLDNAHWHKFGEIPHNSVMLRPTDRFKENIFFLTCTGLTFDIEKALEDHDYIAKHIHDTTKRPNLKIGRMESLANYRPNIRMVSTFQQERIFVAGDAAHVHSATGGQGMNSSVMDAFNLGWKLALVLKNLSTPSLLGSYTEERLPVIKEMLDRTTALLDITVNPNRKATDSRPWQRSTSLNQLGVHYRWSSFVRDELNVEEQAPAQENSSTYVVGEGERLHAGDRAHDASELVSLETGKHKRLFDIYGADHHTTVIFTDQSQDAVSAVKALARYPKDAVRSVVVYPQSSLQSAVHGIDFTLIDKRGHAYSAYPAAPGETIIVIVRPDGVVGGIVRGVDGLEKYFSKIFAA